MKALVIGSSAIAARRAVPAMVASGAFDGIDAASRRGAPTAAALAHGGTAYDSPEEALANSDAGLVYISTENDTHVAWAERALALGRSVVIDKPAAPDSACAQSLVAAAEAGGLLAAEATVFLDHPRIEALRRALDDADTVTTAHACFAFPPLPADNFRYDPARGGGAFADLGPYAAATCRLLFGAAPDKIDTRILESRHVEIAFSVFASWNDGRCFAGTYGFNSDYQNWVSAAGPNIALRLDRFCTPPPDAELALDLRRSNEDVSETCAAGDCFAAFFARAAHAAETGETTPFHAAMLADAAFRDRLREAAS